MNKYPHLSSLIYGQPLLVTPEYAETIAAVTGDRFGINTEGLSISSGAANQREGKLNGRGTQVIPIIGSMTHRATGMDAMSGMTSYSQIQSTLQEAYDNPDVKSILLDMDTPGGLVAGAFDLRDFMMENRGKKPVYALARDTMASAGYLIGSAADKIYTTQTGSVGSIGVVAMFLDQTEKNKKDGVKPTFLHAGKFKVAGNPHEKLEGENLEYLQDSINQSYEMFIDAVADARGMDKDRVRATEARVYRGKKAVSEGLADDVKAFRSTLTELGEAAPRIYSSASIKADKLDVGNQKIEIKGNVMEKDIEKLTADLTEAMSKVEATSDAKSKLEEMITAEGYTITEAGLVKDKNPELMEVEGVLVDKATLPAVVVKALEQKAAAEFKAQAVAQFPNLKEDMAVKMFTAFKGDDEAMKFVASVNTAVGGMMEERGTTPTVDLMSASQKIEVKVKDLAEKSGKTYQRAYADFARTGEGKALIEQSYKE